MARRFTDTRPHKEVIVARLIAGGLPAVFGAMHLVGAAPMKPILEAANIPLPSLGAVVAPIIEVVAGLLLLAGFQARVGALTMLVAIYTHLVADWPDEPPVVVAVVVLAGALYVLWRGGGAWSMDLARQRPAGA
jgi:putative oxidoreductase